MKQYLTPFLLAFGLCAVLLALLLPLLKRIKAGQEILQYVTEHSSKQGTPTMGGIAFILSTSIVALCCCGVGTKSIVVAIAVFVAYGVVGFLDDFLKIKYRHNMGLRAYQKIVVQFVIAVVVALFVYGDATIGDKLYIPFANKQIAVGKAIVPIVIFIYLACTNGVNLTDGLDGLATGSTICYLVGIFVLIFTQTKQLDLSGDTLALAQRQQMLVVIACAVGSLLAFSLFNCFPAKIFMGDVGSLALGALVACTAIFTNLSLVIPILGIAFVVSCLSVIVQVVYFKLSHGKRVFLMAPFHHHLQKKGLSETRIGALYCVATILMAALLICFGG
ncbi:MAG: phospho-N-acetylmuramoyl-pentapeptide-transferase [Clostridia bacterium]|nr:phospho-N-acetylmuramoyl-pentapeptide-transferase [Clostridia bacterium]